ncbi:Ribonuclease P protein subunit p14, putative [Pediculus humanus corporis]|uniref:Ribonuclease P protein subunit p14, putative n=1 Tax=Pediculus humanus subsp. corporis TaxID=121224 RepID=E0W066_PEDHC|nr:Ribonuclease P protein subunit p14, putative [Pediculus humanus corporis]EEB19022.1 Ribonuclease P protein subunit p14, putative [Pediculus humanus corporis]
MTIYYYLDVDFIIENNKVEVDIYKLKQIITSCVRKLFGEAGVGNQVDILKYEASTGQIILRCFRDFYVKLRSSLSFGSEFDDIHYSFYVKKASASILTLLSNNKLYKF